jgi:hypothetical protein
LLGLVLEPSPCWTITGEKVGGDIGSDLRDLLFLGEGILPFNPSYLLFLRRAASSETSDERIGPLDVPPEDSLAFFANSVLALEEWI